MTVFNNKDFITFAGEPITGRVPPRTTVYGPQMNAAQFSGVAHAYKLFCDAYRLSPAGYHVQNRALADGTRIRMTSNNGVDTVKVYTGNDSGFLPLPLGIVISLFKVDEVTDADYYPFWENGARIDITKRGEAETLKEFDVIVQVDPDAVLSAGSFDNGDVSFKLIPKGIVYGASGMYTIEKNNEKVWPKSVTPWYANGFVNVGPYRFDFPNIKDAIDETDPLLKIERFWTVGFPVTTTEFDPKKARGWLFFLVCVDEVTYKVFARKVIGELDPEINSTSKDAELECVEIATQTLYDDIARFRYDMHLTWNNGSFTLEPVGEMYAGEVFSTVSITGDKESAAATLTLVPTYAPTNPSVPAETTTFISSGDKVVSTFGTFARAVNTTRTFGYSRMTYRLVPGKQDPWTREWTRLPSVASRYYSKMNSSTVTYGANEYPFSYTYEVGFTTWVPPSVIIDPNGPANYYTFGSSVPENPVPPEDCEFSHRIYTYVQTSLNSYVDGAALRYEGTGDYTLTGANYAYKPTLTYSSAETATAVGVLPEDNFSITATAAETDVPWRALFVNITSRAPLINYNDEKLIPLNEDMSLGRIAGLFAKNAWTTVFTDDITAANTNVRTSLVVKLRDPLDATAIPDVVVKTDTFCTEFPTLPNFADGISGVSTGASVTTNDPATNATNQFKGSNTFVSGTTLYVSTPPMIGSNGGGLARSSGAEIPLPPVGGNPDAAAYSLSAPTTSYTRAAFLSTFGLEEDVFEIVEPGLGASITHVTFTQGLPPAYTNEVAVDKKYLSGFTPFFENYEGHLYADPRTMSFIAAFAGAGRTDGIGDTLLAGAPLLRSYVGNKQGATPLEPLINAWIEKTNEGRTKASPPLPPYPTYQLGELFIAWADAVQGTSPLI